MKLSWAIQLNDDDTFTYVVVDSDGVALHYSATDTQALKAYMDRDIKLFSTTDIVRRSGDFIGHKRIPDHGADM